MNIIRNEAYRPLLATVCAVGWSLAYPFIKLGYQSFGIGDDLGSKLLFAGIRFSAAGILVLCFGRAMRTEIRIREKTLWPWVALFAMVNTGLHYLFSYIGLANIQSARATILDSTGGFLLILLSGLLYAEDRLNRRKLIGCAVGMLGIAIINVAPVAAWFEGVSFLGDGFILLNACCAACGGILTRILSKKVNMTAATGWGMLLGGVFLTGVSAAVGVDRPWTVTARGIAILVVLILISAVCFEIYNLLLANHPISKVAIYNALIPVLGVVFASILLREPFRWQYILAGLCVATGIWIVNRAPAGCSGGPRKTTRDS